MIAYSLQWNERFPTIFLVIHNVCVSISVKAKLGSFAILAVSGQEGSENFKTKDNKEMLYIFFV